MDVAQLTTFERIVREGSFSRAAWALGVAQPTVSARIQALERALGGPLFRRGGRGVALTDLGLSFLPYARRAIEVLDAGVAAARQAQAGQRGQVTIGVLESLSGSFLGPALATFHAAYPGVAVLVRAGRHEQVVDLLRDGVVALALLAWPCPESLTLPLEVLLPLRERVLLVAAPQHPLARTPQLAPDWVLVARPFLVLRWWLTLPPAVAQLAQAVQPTIDAPMDTGRQMVLSGVGVGFFPWMQVADAVRGGQLHELSPPGVGVLNRDSALVRRAEGAPLAPAAAALVAILQQRATQLGLVA
ncbi:MAG: LysR family transcriptional regulator [Chloroflexota bacterium]|nr:LysR family transcriptional regulator [Chloroflexota bacterium]